MFRKAFFFILFFIIIIFNFLPYYPIYSSFNLVKASYSSKNPIKFFRLKNYTNITFIARYYNITNLSIIFEKFESEENFINYKINFTSINKDIKFESDLKRYKILSIILAILCTINHIVLIFFIFCKIKFNIINYSKEVLIISFLFLSYIISTILSIIILIITRRLNKLLSYFYSLIIRLFKVKISKFVMNEINHLRSAISYEILNLFYLFFIICLIIFECKNSTDHMPIRTNNFLNKLIGGK